MWKIQTTKRFQIYFSFLIHTSFLTCVMAQISTHDPNFLSLSDVSKSINRHPQIEEIVGTISESEIKKNLKTLVSFGTRHSLSDTTSQSRGIGAARRWIYKQLQEYSSLAGERLTVKFDRFIAEGQRLPGPTEMVNIVATLPGIHPQEKDRIYVVSGHYDSRNSDPMDGKGDAPGANDDGSGTVVVMELARVLSRFEFDATLIFLVVAGEEQGLYGSRHWATEAQQKGLKIEGMITNDVVGGGRGGNGVLDLQTLRCFSAGPTDSPHRQLARFGEEHVKTYLDNFSLQLIFRADRYRRGGDHMSFMKAGYPAIRFTEPHENYNHQHQNIRQEDGITYGDLIEFVNFNYIANVTRANAIILATLAQSPPPPANITLTGAVQHDTHIAWDAPQEGLIYQIIIRETTAPKWQKIFEADSKKEATLKGISVDNYFFGVRSVNSEGFVSVVVTPDDN